MNKKQQRTHKNPYESKYEKLPISLKDQKDKDVMFAAGTLAMHELLSGQKLTSDPSIILAAIDAWFEKNPELKDLILKLMIIANAYWERELDPPDKIIFYLNQFSSQVKEIAG